MNLYPAMRASMGRWDYFMVKMNMRELGESVKFAHDVYEDKTLDDAIQRVLNEGRVKKEIVTYLARQQDRFFSSVVVAALGGNPKWYPVMIEGDPQFAILAGDERLNNSFGVLAFDGSQAYYALDGQHRLSAIKTLLDPNDDASGEAPQGFREEEISVLVVVPRDAEDEAEFFKRYRRLFGNLNRYAKAMDQVTNIIMDEDDVFAIITRRLISNHRFLHTPGRQRESFRIKTAKGKNLRQTDGYFTSLETLYEMNIALLSSRQRETDGWGNEIPGPSLKEFKRFRPDEDYIDALYDELALYWDALLAELPVLESDPPTMRNHSADPQEDSEDEDTSDHLLFWPIGQELLANVARDMLDHRLRDTTAPTLSEATEALRGLSYFQWELHQPPWRYFLLTQGPTGAWTMRSEDRAATLRWADVLVRWMLGIYDLDQAGIEQVRQEWAGRLIPAQSAETVDAMWEEIMDHRRRLVSDL